MPTFRKLTVEESAHLARRRGRAVDLTDYLQAVRELEPGQVGEATIGDGEKKATIKRRLTMAARSLDRTLRYRRTGEDRIIYELAVE
jgi:hypothetical protein